MPQGSITKRAVDALHCPAGKDRYFLWDDDLAGFGVAAFPTGRKVYVAQYRKDGRSRRVSIGEHGRLTPDEARKQAKVLLGAVETGAGLEVSPGGFSQDHLVQGQIRHRLAELRLLRLKFLAPPGVREIVTPQP